jgi:hypothetical protein
MKTARFEPTDRTPLYDIFQNNAVIEHYAGEPLLYEEGWKTTARAVGRALDMTRMITGPQKPSEAVNGDGMRIRTERWTSWIAERPFHNLTTLIPWVEARIAALRNAAFTADEARACHDHIESLWTLFAEADPTGRHDPTVLVIESGVGLDHAFWATGFELFTEMMYEVPDLLDEWLELLVQAELRRVAGIADPYHIPIALTYADIAHKTGTMLSPEWLREHYFPRLRRLNDAWQERGVLCLYHSDGNLWSVMDDLVATGIDGLNPLEILADMRVEPVRERYPSLFLAGGIDVSQLLTYGTPDEVADTCRAAIRATQGRGFFMGSSTELHWEVPLANARAMYELEQTL